MDILHAGVSYLNLDAARGDSMYTSWRAGPAPFLPLSTLLDFVGVAGIILLVVMTIVRSLPDESRRRIVGALTIFAAGILVGFARRFVDPSHDHEGAWGALQLGIMSLAIVTLVWRTRAARYLALAGAAVFTLRQPMIWRASEAYVLRTGDASVAYAAEATRLAAHAVGATGALLLAIALFLAATMPPSAGSSARRESVGAPAARAEQDLERRAPGLRPANAVSGTALKIYGD
jgi:hypothetical protein